MTEWPAIINTYLNNMTGYRFQKQKKTDKNRHFIINAKTVNIHALSKVLSVIHTIKPSMEKHRNTQIYYSDLYYYQHNCTYTHTYVWRNCLEKWTKMKILCEKKQLYSGVTMLPSFLTSCQLTVNIPQHTSLWRSRPAPSCWLCMSLLLASYQLRQLHLQLVSALSVSPTDQQTPAPQAAHCLHVTKHPSIKATWSIIITTITTITTFSFIVTSSDSRFPQYWVTLSFTKIKVSDFA